MPDVIQFRVCSGSQSWLIPMSQNAKVDDLFHAITENYIIGINPSKMRLIYGDKFLEYGNEKCIKDYSLAHLSTIVVILPVCGGVLPLLTGRDMKTSLVPLQGFITVTSSYSEPDMITFDADPDEKRARMPCGHVIGPESMTGYCQSVLSKGEFKFYCPSVDLITGKANCNREWDYFLVRHVACLSADELNEFEKKISDNYLKKASGMQKCPGCKTWCYKEDDTGNFVRCPLCRRDFCWACMRDWIGSSNRQLCGNVDCDGRDSRTRILACCPTKEIGCCPACPTTRACPKCGMLTEHKVACGHVECPSCSHGFCFICLAGRRSKLDWLCSPGGTCTLAPRQTGASFRAPASQPAIQPASQPANQPANQPASLESWLENWLETWVRDWRCTIL